MNIGRSVGRRRGCLSYSGGACRRTPLQEHHTMTSADLWQRYQQYVCGVPALGLTLDVSRMRFDDAYLQKMEPAMRRAFEAMAALEKGAIANPDEKRMVGHYWLRAPERAPTPEITSEVRRTLSAV